MNYMLQSIKFLKINVIITFILAYIVLDDMVLAAEELRFATHALGKITGQVDVEEILGVIFQQFCIGK